MNEVSGFFTAQIETEVSYSVVLKSQSGSVNSLYRHIGVTKKNADAAGPLEDLKRTPSAKIPKGLRTRPSTYQIYSKCLRIGG